MNETIDQVAQVITPQIETLSHTLLTYLQSGVGVVKEQAPLLVNEIIGWGIAKYSLLIIIGILLVIFTTIISIKVYSHCKSKSIDDDEWVWPFMFLNMATVVPSIVFTISNIFSLVKILVAPRLYLIEYFQSLVN